MNYIKEHLVWVIVVGVILAAAFGSFYLLGGTKPAYQVTTVKRASLTEAVTATGTVKPAENVQLAFERGGKISQSFGKVGDTVQEGQILAQLYNVDIYGQLVQAQALVKAQQAKLDELKQGTRPEELQIAQSAVDNANSTLDQTKKNVVNTIKTAYTTSDDAIHNKVDQFYSSPRSSIPQITLPVDSTAQTSANSGRLQMEILLSGWAVSVQQLDSATSDLASAITISQQNLTQISSFLDMIASAVNSLTPSTNLLQTTITGYRSDISVARANINAGIANVAAAEQSLKANSLNLTVVQEQLALKKAGATSEDITAQEAALEGAEAAVTSASGALSKTILRAPFAGTIAQQDAKIGEITSPNVPLISLISGAEYQIETNVSEADIAKIKMENPGHVTLDAYGTDAVFDAKIVSIDPAETVVNGTPVYKIKLQFLNKDDRIKSGMTANVNIVTAIKDNVLVVPKATVITRGTDKFVLINAKDGKQTEQKVETGIYGEDGNVEITSGLNEGQEIINF